MHKAAGCWAALVACTAAVGHAQENPAAVAFREIEQLLVDLLSVSQTRDECLRLFPSRATDILAAYANSSASRYPDLLRVNDPLPVLPEQLEPRHQDQSSNDDGWSACLANLVASLERFDSEYANRQDELTALYHNQDRAMANSRARVSSPTHNVLSEQASLSPEGARVTVVRGGHGSLDFLCTFVSNLSTPARDAELATIALRNEAARQGGDTLLVIDSKVGESSILLFAETQRCN
jgi:hypothetical protein